MRPVETAATDVVYVGPPDVGDLYAERTEPGLIASVWELSDDERRQIAEGANVKLYIWQEPIPPVTLELTFEQGVGEDDTELRRRLAEFKAQQSAGDEPSAS